MTDPRFDVVLVVYHGRRALTEFLAHLPVDVPLVVVDNSAVAEDVTDLLAGRPRARHVDAGGNVGFSAGSNLGARAATAPYLIFLNPDVVPSRAVLDALADWLDRHPGYASVGAAGLGSSGGGAQPTLRRALIHSLGLHRLWRCGGIFYYPYRDQVVDVEWVAGSCLAIRRSAFLALGGFDPAYFIYMSDFDLGRKLAAAGHRQALRGDVILPHEEGASTDAVSPVRMWERRGRGWTRYLLRTRAAGPALAILAVIAWGYAARAAYYVLTRQQGRRAEMTTYLQSMGRELVQSGEAA